MVQCVESQICHNSTGWCSSMLTVICAHLDVFYCTGTFLCGILLILFIES